jgi:hypothetical protein
MDTRFTVAMEAAAGFLGEKRMTGWWFGTFFFILYGMSSFPLTNSIIFQDG